VRALREALRAASGEGSAEERTIEAAAFYAEVPLASDDDALLAAQADVVEWLADELRKAGYRLHVQTGTALLAVRALSADADERKTLCALGEELARGPSGIDPRLLPSIELHVGSVQVREAADGPAFSGPLLQIETWASGTAPGFRPTAAAKGGDTAPPHRTGAP
jgi:hypothetical protein